MNKIIICLCLTFSLLAAPVIHAAGLDCVSDGCHKTEQSKSKSEEGKQDNSKLSAAGQHCCCAYTSFKSDSDAFKIGFMPSTGKQIILSQNAAIISVVVGPPLEPPSRA